MSFDVIPGIVVNVDEVAKIMENLALVKKLLRRVVDGVLGVAFIKQGERSLVVGGLTDVFRSGFGNLCIAQEVDERFGFRRVLAGFRDDDVVKPKV